MKIVILENNNWKTLPRIRPFFNILEKLGHIIQYTTNETDNKNIDVLIVEYQGESYELQFLNSYIKNFDGKLIICSVDDISKTYCQNISDEVLDRIDAWITLVMPSYDSFTSHIVENKFVLFPRFNWYYIPLIESNLVRENKIYCHVSTTGYCNFKGNKNLRVEAIKLIRSSNITDSIVGGLAQDYIIDLDKNKQDEIYNNTFKRFFIGHIKYEEYLKKLKLYTTSLCLPGNSKWGTRHMDSMACKCNILSVDPRNDPGKWFLQEEISQCLTFIKEDLSDLIEQCQYMLDNYHELQEKRDKLYEIYKTYYELNTDGTYKDSIWINIYEKFHKLEIKI